jgi:hypothetical protein
VTEQPAAIAIFSHFFFYELLFRFFFSRYYICI